MNLLSVASNNDQQAPKSGAIAYTGFQSVIRQIYCRLFGDARLAQMDRAQPSEGYMELGSGEAIKQAVMSDMGIAMLSTFSLRLELDNKRLVLLDVEGLPIKRHWYAVHRRGKHLTPSALKFIEFLQTSDLHELSNDL